MTAQGTPADLPELSCLHCGYDLRMIPSDLCPECGQAVERNANQTSRIPWGHRVVQGRVRAYWRTALLATFRQRWMTDELRRPADIAAAKRFWLITSTLVALPMMVAYGIWWVNIGYLQWTPPAKVAFMSPPATDREVTIYHELTMPWMMGIHFSPLMVVLIWVTVLTNFGIATYLLDIKSQSPIHRSRGIAVAYYACGSMIWLPLLASVGLILTGILHNLPQSPVSQPMIASLILGGLGFTSILIYWMRLVASRATLKRSGVLATLLNVPLLPALWISNTAFWLLILPWSLGYVWILIRSW